MKELSTEDKAKRYDEAISKMKEIITMDNATTSSIEIGEYVFPELKSEDEKIRKELITHFKNTRCVTKEGAEKILKWITWLEKQDKQPTDKVEPKFHPGDWITNGQLTCKVLGAVGKSYELHLYNDDYCHFETDVQSVDEDYHLWSIADAKDSDILVDAYGNIGIFDKCYYKDNFI